ncbi:MAG TPA: YbaB/EbfC family DNA-binding protein [Actinophytocola sp.]|uniref:YbaB/EbfC family DNA-binding protein n=1 Tax=Actinophytocola sp. TaxID=1872138 RepID=UPI002DBA3A95|nr:YbaB/EbfC family DNA-binding protein [Actinophytocola sp.]HEU5473980.1 YbaB/EbfC family DNA-binding protein [Actinophytocola sp.]
MTDITGTARTPAVVAEVYPGGALRSLTLSERASALGRRALAEAVVAAVAEATARANQRARHALGDAVTRLGLDTDAGLVERVETTTPHTWRV